MNAPFRSDTFVGALSSRPSARVVVGSYALLGGYHRLTPPRPSSAQRTSYDEWMGPGTRLPETAKIWCDELGASGDHAADGSSTPADGRVFGDRRVLTAAAQPTLFGPHLDRQPRVRPRRELGDLSRRSDPEWGGARPNHPERATDLDVADAGRRHLRRALGDRLPGYRSDGERLGLRARRLDRPGRLADQPRDPGPESGPPRALRTSGTNRRGRLASSDRPSGDGPADAAASVRPHPGQRARLHRLRRPVR